MNARQLQAAFMTAIFVLVVLLLLRHFQFKAALPTLPNTQGLMGD